MITWCIIYFSQPSQDTSLLPLHDQTADDNRRESQWIHALKGKMIPDWLGWQTKKHQTQTKLIYVNGKKHGTASPTGFQRCTQTPNNSVPTDTTTTGNANQNPDQQTTQSNVQLESHTPSTNITLSPPKQLATQNTQWLSLVLWNAHSTSIVNKLDYVQSCCCGSITL